VGGVMTAALRKLYRRHTREEVGKESATQNINVYLVILNWVRKGDGQSCHFLVME
jgi:hypothetical protein